jgi:hypothetical protein
MTRDEIMNMPTGREMDVVIAEKVFGWQWESFKDYERLYILDGSNSRRYGAMRQDGEMEYTSNLPKYSRDMGAAWEVVDQMLFQSNQGVYLRFKNHLAELMGNQLQPSWIMSAFICRAALLAIIEL